MSETPPYSTQRDQARGVVTACLIVCALLVPLFWWPESADFASPKWVAMAMFAAFGLSFATSGRRPPPLGRFGVLFGLVFGGLVLLTLWSGRRTGLDMRGSIAAFAQLATMGSVFAVAACHAHVGISGWVSGSIAASPTLVLGAQLLLQSGLRPLDLPFSANRLTATLGNSAWVGLFALSSLSIVPFLLRRGSTRSQSLCGWSGLLSSMILIVRSDARAAWLGALIFFATWGVIGVFRRSRLAASSVSPGSIPTRAAAMILGLSVVVVFLDLNSTQPTPEFGARTLSIFQPKTTTNRVRLELWRDAGRMAFEHAASGAGLGRFGDLHDRYRQPEEWSISGLQSRAIHPHNEYLRFFSETGVIGGALLATLLVALVHTLWKRASSGRFLVLPGWLSLATAAGFWDITQQPATMLPVLLVSGFAFGLIRDEVGPPKPIRCWLVIAASAVGGTFLTWIISMGIQGTILDLNEAKRQLLQAESGGERAPEALVADLAQYSHQILEEGLSPYAPSDLRRRALMEVDDLNSVRRRLLQTLSRPQEGLEENERIRLVNVFSLLPSDSETRTFIDHLIQLSPHETGLRVAGAEFETKTGRISEAINHVNAGLQINPKAPLLRPIAARIRFSSQLYSKSFADLLLELELYGRAAESDTSWELLARTWGAAGGLREAIEVVDRWVEQLGDIPRRRRVAGELSLHLGETLTTLGAFYDTSETPSVRNERGTHLVQSFEGSAARERREHFLAHLGRYPFDAPVLDGLATALQELAVQDGGDDASLFRDQRRRAITRSKILYAFEHLGDGNRRLFEISIRAARRLSPEWPDAFYLELRDALARDDLSDLVLTLKTWRTAGLNDFAPLELYPELAESLRRAEVRRHFND